MDITVIEFNTLLRKHLKASGHFGLGWRAQYFGSIFTAACTAQDVQFGEVMLVKKFVEEHKPEMRQTQAHFSCNDRYGAVINWAS